MSALAVALALSAGVPAATVAASPAMADALCGEQPCPPSRAADLLARAQAAVLARDFAAAAPLLEALAKQPGYNLEYRFLAGFTAAETGNLAEAATLFRAILADDPSQLRVRMELARALQGLGKTGAAEYHYRLAQESGDLPPELMRAVSATRSILRDRRQWRFAFDVGLAPDSNINSGTDAETVNVNFGPIALPLTLDGKTRRTSGLGQTGSYSAGYRFRVGDSAALLVESGGTAVNYDGRDYDDISTSLGIGPELKLGSGARFSLVATGERRWYGGSLASSDHGARLGGEMTLGASMRIGAALDARHSRSHLSADSSGWLLGGNITAERVIGRSIVASASLFARRDLLAASHFSSTSFGATLGLGGELPLGLNAGLSATLSKAHYDAPWQLFSTEKRQDNRFSARAYLGLRSLRLLGFSPSVEYVFARNASNYTLNQSERSRFQFKLARYF